MQDNVTLSKVCFEVENINVNKVNCSYPNVSSKVFLVSCKSKTSKLFGIKRGF